jgi:hypothetical protein
MAEALNIPASQDELENICRRLTIWMRAMEQVEAELGDEMNKVDPIPPVTDHRV